MNRRAFSSLMAYTALSAILPSPAFAEQPEANTLVAPDAAELYKKSLILDCNSSPPGLTGKLPMAQADLDLARASGVSVVKISLGGINSDFAATVEEIAFLQQMIEVHPAYFLQVRIPADMERAKREGKLGLIFSFESADMFGGEVQRIELFRNLGVRVMQLSYNRKSPFAAGVMEPTGGGLTELGKRAATQMNTSGVAIDLSHANGQTTVEAIGASTKPVIMTHAGCAAIHPHPRNKSDEQLRALAGKGGVVGIYDLPYLAASPKQPTVDDYMAHMEHALKVAGEEHVGIGSDVGIEPFDTSPQGIAEFNKVEKQRQQSGLAAPEEDRPTYVVGLNTARRIEVIADQLRKRGYPGRVAEKVLGANFVRVFSEIWT